MGPRLSMKHKPPPKLLGFYRYFYNIGPNRELISLQMVSFLTFLFSWTIISHIFIYFLKNLDAAEQHVVREQQVFNQSSYTQTYRSE